MSTPFWVRLTNADGDVFLNVSQIVSVKVSPKKVVTLRMRDGSMAGPYSLAHVEQQGLVTFLRECHVGGIPPES